MSRPLRTARPATYEDLVAAPDHVVAELIDGTLLMSPRPAPPHAACASAIGGELNFRFGRPGDGGGDRPGGWWILHEPELHLGAALGRPGPREVALVPDVAGWRRARMPQLPDAAAFTLPPDWVCEVLSPSTERLDRLRKLALYAEAGVGFVWLVDPAARFVEVYRPTGGGLPTRVRAWSPDDAESSDVHDLPPFEGVALGAGDWWPPLD